MGLAPRDGTIVEIENNHGKRPWYDIYCWRDGEGWVNARDPSRSLIAAEQELRWRPYSGEIDGYVDDSYADDTIDDAAEAYESRSWWDSLRALFMPQEPQRPLDRYLEPADSDTSDSGARAGRQTPQNDPAHGQPGLACERA